MKNLYLNFNLLIALLFCFGMSAFAQQSLNVTFNGDDYAGWASYGDSYTVTNGHHDCIMAVQNNGSYRGDLKFNNGNSTDLNFTLDPSKDVYLAIKFIGSRPKGSLKMEFNDGSQWFNTKWNGGNPALIETAGGNYIYYFQLSSDDKYTGNSINVRRMNFTIADAKEEPYSYKIDWITSFKTVEEIEAYKNVADDGEGDLDDYIIPAVLNQTTNIGYPTLNAAVTASEDGDIIVVNEDVTITSRINIAKPISIIACENGASIIRGYTNGLVLLTQTGGDVTIGGLGGKLTLDGANLISSSNFIESSNGATTTINDNVIIKNCYSTNLNGPTICNKSNGQLVLNGVTFENCKTLNGEGVQLENRGVVFIGTALTLAGNNQFIDCVGAGVFLERNTMINAQGANHSSPIEIMIQDPSTRTAKDVVLNYTDETKMRLINSGYKLISDGKNLQFTLSTNVIKSSIQDEMHIRACDGSIYINATMSKRVFIYNINGIKVCEIQLHAGENIINTLPRGVYFINKQKVVI